MKLPKILISALALVAVPLFVFAQGTLPTPEDVGSFLNAFLAASVNVKVALALVAAVWALRKYAVKDIAFFRSDEGGVVLLSLTSFLVTLSGSFYRLQGPVTLPWLQHVAFVAFAAAVVSGGMWNLIQAYVRLLAPKAVEGTWLAKVPLIGPLVGKLADIALGLVKSKLDKAASELEPAVVPAPLVVAPPASEPAPEPASVLVDSSGTEIAPDPNAGDRPSEG